MERYVALHEAGDFKFSKSRALLRSFVTFAEAAGDEYVKVDRVLEWATRAPSVPQRRRRLGTVRQFALEMGIEAVVMNCRPTTRSDAVGSSVALRTSTRLTKSGAWSTGHSH